MQFKQKRRQFLKSTAGALAASGFLPFMNSPAYARGQGPTRLVVIMTGYGGRWEYFRPRGLGELYEPASASLPQDDTALAIDVELTPEALVFENSALQPLAPYASKMTVLEGLSFHNALIEGSLYSGHENSPGNVFTGSLPRFKNHDVFSHSASIEYALGQQLGGETAVRSAVLGIGATVGTNVYDSIAFDASGNRLQGFWNPYETFTYLMGTGAGSGGGSAMLTGQQAMLDALQSSAERLRARLAGREQYKLDQHLAALDEIERTLGGQSAPLPCSDVQQPSGNPDANGPSMDDHTEAMFEIIAQALACDRTRFVNCAWGHNAGTFSPWLEPRIDDWHNHVAHVVGGDSDPAIQAANLSMARLHNFYASALKRFLDRLDSIPEGDGTVLDNTLIVWAQDFGPIAHSGLNVPYVLLGGGAEKFRMGRYISSYTNPPGYQWGTGDPANYTANNKLFNAILTAFGLPGQDFGGISGNLTSILRA